MADLWYSGPKGDLWVEYKFLRDGKIPVRAAIDPAKYLSAMQMDWLNTQSGYGRNVWVIIGCKDGGVVLFYQDEWSSPIPPDEFRTMLKTRKELAEVIMSRVIHGP